MEKYRDGMGYNELSKNARLLVACPPPGGWGSVKCVGSWSDVSFWVDEDGNIWEEYVPTFD